MEIAMLFLGSGLGIFLTCMMILIWEDTRDIRDRWNND
jgi:hypothetical protein